jgi:hypothetical protein
MAERLKRFFPFFWKDLYVPGAPSGPTANSEDIRYLAEQLDDVATDLRRQLRDLSARIDYVLEVAERVHKLASLPPGRPQPRAEVTLSKTALHFRPDVGTLAARLERDLSKVVARSVAAMESEFQAKAERVLPKAYAEPVQADYADVDRPRNLRVGKLPEDMVATLRKSKMDDRHAHLDDLMQD